MSKDLAGSGEATWRQAPKVVAWEKSLAMAGCVLEKLELLQGLRKRDGTLLFALVRATGRDAEGRPLLPYALLQGPAVVVVPAITLAETGEEKFLMVSQCRLGHGRMALEFPAGMLDETLHDPASVALHELAEETRLEAGRSELIALHPKALYPSPGLSDEGIWFFACRKTLTQAQCEALHGGMTGVAHEGEHIRVELLARRELLPRLDSMQSLMALSLYDAWLSRPK